MKVLSGLFVAGAVLAGLFEFAAAYDRDLMICLVNRERGQRGLGYLGRNAALDNAAQRHSDDMAARICTLTHTGSDGSGPADRITAAGYNWQGVAENIASGYPDEQICMQKWMESTGHRKNILTPKFTQFGSAVAYSAQSTPFYTQTFGCAGEAGPFPECPGQSGASVAVQAEATVEAAASNVVPAPAPVPVVAPVPGYTYTY